MKTFSLIKPVCLAVLLAFVAVAVTSCSKTETPGAAAKENDVDYYTCSMHPSVHLHDPNAKCPICGMNLIPVYKKGAKPSSTNAEPGGTNAQTSEFMVPTERLQQIGVTFARAERKPLQKAIRAVGTVTYDKQRHWDYVARVDGYIQKLHVASRGDFVEKGQPLLSIFSPDLLTTEREFVNVLKLRDAAQKSSSSGASEADDRLLEAAKRRLQLWNVSDEEIAELEKTRAPRDVLTLRSPFKGIVQDIPVDQGRRIGTGDHLVDVADLSLVWIWTEFYQDELPLLKTNLPVTVTSSSFPNETFTGKIHLIDPFLNEMKRTVRARIDVENPNQQLRPEMFVNVELHVDAGEGLTIPTSAVMPTGEREVVFVDKGEGRLEPRFVKLGGKFGSDYEVVSGVKEGEQVVASANFLIDAEAKLQGALQSW